jgi:putative ABC transport system substrate-binding protein
MKRREFIAGLGGAAALPLVWPLSARAQQAMPVVGFLHGASAKSFAHIVAGLRQGLKDTGFTEGQNVAIEFRWAEGQYDRLPAMAADLVGRRVTLIVTGGGDPVGSKN